VGRRGGGKEGNLTVGGVGAKGKSSEAVTLRKGKFCAGKRKKGLGGKTTRRKGMSNQKKKVRLAAEGEKRWLPQSASRGGEENNRILGEKKCSRARKGPAEKKKKRSRGCRGEKGLPLAFSKKPVRKKGKKGGVRREQSNRGKKKSEILKPSGEAKEGILKKQKKGRLDQREKSTGNSDRDLSLAQKEIKGGSSEGSTPKGGGVGPEQGRGGGKDPESKGFPSGWGENQIKGEKMPLGKVTELTILQVEIGEKGGCQEKKERRGWLS